MLKRTCEDINLVMKRKTTHIETMQQYFFSKKT